MLNLEEGIDIVKLARQTIEHYLREGKKPEPPEKTGGVMEENRGVFVTLNRNDELRGCIGRPLPNQTLVDGLMDSAISAATQDPRFPSLTLEELEDITVEVSVLTPPEKIEVEDPKELPKKVKVGRDGLIVEGTGRKGLLLPQVPVDRGWSAEDFLSQTCVKAGLSPDEWITGNVEVEKFSAQVFKEKEPEGKIIEESFIS
ncbi:hypothetical protein AKJ65_03915 [candidate division MSBL1 archaeon SCGC-AAA259E19]|uniref:Protein AKJ65_03915 n=1 Tax=candidate division MSBL1 archaeon SCGC-AAA259E19 TaxID=1698264 RepID=A0A133UKA3_9EURY|nr:hypothetical protein AKJ65_03915 [candidate division MSBL1 archaeon SCGC-AAA259E19]